MSDMTSNILAYKPISSLAYNPNITLSITTLNCGATEFLPFSGKWIF